MVSGVSLEARLDDNCLDQDNPNRESTKPEREPKTSTDVRLIEYGFEQGTWEYFAARAAVESLSGSPRQPSSYVIGKMFDEMPKKYRTGEIKIAEEKLREILDKLIENQVFCFLREVQEKRTSLRWKDIWRGKNYGAVIIGETISDSYTDLIGPH